MLALIKRMEKSKGGQSKKPDSTTEDEPIPSGQNLKVMQPKESPFSEEQVSYLKSMLTECVAIGGG